jgi:hypothetical protein
VAVRAVRFGNMFMIDKKVERAKETNCPVTGCKETPSRVRGFT